MILARFKVYPSRDNPLLERNTHYYQVAIHDTPASLQRWAYRRTLSDKEKQNDYVGVVIPVSYQHIETGEIKYGERRGYVGLVKPYLSMTILTHESVHVATTYLRTLTGIHLDEEGVDDNEERLAYCVGSVARQLNKHIYKRGLYG